MEYNHGEQPAAKKLRTEAPTSPAMSDDFDDADDFFDTPVKAASPPVQHEKQDEEPRTDTAIHSAPAMTGKPTDDASVPPVPPVLPVAPVQPVGVQPPPPTPATTLGQAPQTIADTKPEEFESAVSTALGEAAPSTANEPESKLGTADLISEDETTDDSGPSNLKRDEVMQDNTQAITGGTEAQPPVDPEFIAAAEAIKGDENAEWQYDSSDAESSDDSTDSSDDSDDDDSDDDYVLLDPREQARILMAEEGGSDDEGGSKKNKGGGGALRTANERPDEVVEKPDVTITPEMTIKELGHVEITVENYVLVKGTISAETQVLETGTVLCLADKTVIGAIAEPIGRVEEPRYSVAFTNAAEIKNYGITAGTKIFYVEEFAKYVFTGPLKMKKGTDASNQHDEELPEDEMEFSDDEAEAEYKRSKKMEKLVKQGKLKHDHMKPDPESAMAGASYDTSQDLPLRYEDGDEDEDMYTPLSRPANIEGAGMTSRPIQKSGRGGADRGRGRGRGGDRGRGNRGGRGGRGRGDSGMSSPALSHASQPTSFNTPVQASGTAVSSPKAVTPGNHNQIAQPAGHQSHVPAQAYHQHQPHPGYQAQPSLVGHQHQAAQFGYHNQPPQAGYQNGYQGMPAYPPQYQQQQQQQWNPPMQGASFPSAYPPQYAIPPPGAYVNPAFFPAMQGHHGQAPAFPQQNQPQYHQNQQQGRQNYGRGGHGQGY